MTDVLDLRIMKWLVPCLSISKRHSIEGKSLLCGKLEKNWIQKDELVCFVPLVENNLLLSMEQTPRLMQLKSGYLKARALVHSYFMSASTIFLNS